MSNNTYASRLINYVEPVEYKGEYKTAFYSEFGTNFNVNDKVYIINGNYDSNNYINSYTFSSDITGYKILSINNCQIVLDINYTGELPYNTDNYDNYIKVHIISSQKEFDYINSITTNTYGTYSSKFEYELSNNIIYVNGTYSGTFSSELALNNGVNNEGFYQKQTSTNNWIEITASFSIGIIGYKTTGTYPTYSLISNNRILVEGSDITYNNVKFKEKVIYNYDSTNSKWKVDETYIKPFISKLNFRNGSFNGNWNDGVFGSYEKEITWNSPKAKWKSGVFINSIWATGSMGSRNSNESEKTNYINSLYSPSFVTGITNSYSNITIDSITESRTIEYNSPIKQINNQLYPNFYSKLIGNDLSQTSDYSDNKGFGFNYIIDSNIENGKIANGNFENCNVGLTSYGINALDVYYGLAYTYSLQVLKGNFNYCNLNSALINRSTIVNSIVENANINKSVLSSNQIINTVANGEYNTNNSVKIIGADLWSYIPKDSGQKRGVLKLYIQEKDLDTISNFDSIYIDNINKSAYPSLFTDNTKINIAIENKYSLDQFVNPDIAYTSTGTNSILVSIKSAEDNNYKTYIAYSGGVYSNTYVNNVNKNPSIDIDLSESMSWYTDGTNSYYTNTLFTTDNINKLFYNANIVNSDFKSGILINSNWKSGYNFNEPSNKILSSGGSYSIKVISGSTNSITIDISNKIPNKYFSSKIGDYVWLNGLDYGETESSIASSMLLNATFKITSTTNSIVPNSRRFILTEITNNIYNNSMTASGRFFVNNLNPEYLSLSSLKIDNSTVVNGTFKNSYFVNSNFTNTEFNNLDKSLTNNNINKLKLINILLNHDNNTINNGLFHNSHILNTKWNNGISFNNILYNATFSNGLFKNGYWVDGVFENGVFFESNSIISATSSFELTSKYKAWTKGVFNNGQFYSSKWIDGEFNNGKFYNSDWYGGNWYNGILGTKYSRFSNTTFGSQLNIGTGSTISIWHNGVVESGLIGGSSSVMWYNGEFNNGEFTSNGYSYSSIWYDGVFKGGKFTKYAKWKYGVFNNGKFVSNFGYTNSNSTYSSDYSWEGGKFKGGQFGEPITTTNSTWYDGEFDGDIFYGKVWNKGIFVNGYFYGNGATTSTKNEQNFMNYFTNSYYGLWRDGSVLNAPYFGNLNEKINILEKRDIQKNKKTVEAKFKNIIWLNGTFSHSNGTFENSVWLDGNFANGKFKDSAFNPFVDRTLAGSTSSQSFNMDDSCVWNNGTSVNSSFYISQWNNGIFNGGYMLGGIWKNGSWLYGDAVNIYWEKGLWKNGNWYGTSFNDDTLTDNYVSDLKTKYVLYNIANKLGTSSIHLLNVFTGSVSTEYLHSSTMSKESISDYSGWTQSGSQQWLWGNTYIEDASGTSYVRSGFNYKYSGSGQSNVIYGLTNSAGGFTTSIFTASTAYNISSTIFVNYNGLGYTTYPTKVTFYTGYTSSTIDCYQGMNYINLSLSSEPSYWTSYSPEFAIIKLAGTPDVDVDILSCSIKSINVSYDFNNNNKQYTPYGSTPTMSSTNSLPGVINSTVADGGITTIQYGNGRFVSGIWENGIWNNGWRNDTTLTRCELSSSSYIKMSGKTHRIQLTFLDQNQSLFTVGDYVSIGNVVAIDINNKRRLIKDKFKVVNIGPTYIIFDIDINLPIRYITQDSDKHLIYVSKNIWLSGAFLNGYFNGIWNYGLFKGYPYITYMKDSHFIDGYFDGGHFQSTTASGPSSSSYDYYNTGLIQNFDFKENNIEIPTKFKFNSWIDVNYAYDTQTNIYENKNRYIENGALAYKGVYSNPNLHGLITYDVLSSKSHMRNTLNNDILTYNLGIKYEKYTNYLENIGDFKDLFDKNIPYLGMGSFSINGWTYSSAIGGNTQSFTYSGQFYNPETFILSNIDNTLHFGSATLSGNATFASTSIGHTLFLNNSNAYKIPDNRYSILEYKVLSFTGFEGPSYSSPRALSYGSASYFRPVITTLQSPSTYSTTQLVANSFWTQEPVKREFFYNKHGLEMIITSQRIELSQKYPIDIVFEYIYLYETDMIPFFSYTGLTDSYINKNIKQPYSAVAPYIDYSSYNFNFIENINIMVNSSLISTTTTTVPSISPSSPLVFDAHLSRTLATTFTIGP